MQASIRKILAACIIIAIVVPALLIVTGTASAYYTWTRLGLSKNVYSLARDWQTGTIYAGCDDGHVYSYAGSSWSDTGAPGTGTVHDLAYDRTTDALYAASNNGTVYKKQLNPPGGWMTIGEPSSPASIVNTIEHGEGNFLYAGCTDGTVHKKDLSGAGLWIDTGALAGIRINALSYDPSGVMFAAENTVPGDGGRVWAKVGAGVWNSLGVPGTTLAATSGLAYDSIDNAVFASNNNGVFKKLLPSGTWTNTGLAHGDIITLAYEPARNAIYAGRSNTIGQDNVFKLNVTTGNWITAGKLCGGGSVNAIVAPLGADYMYVGTSDSPATNQDVYAFNLPTLGALNPDSGAKGSTLNVAIAGNFTDFASNAQVAFSGTGITVNTVTVSSAIGLRANITISTAAEMIARNVTVSYTDSLGGIETLPPAINAFTVLPSAQSTWYLAEGSTSWGFSTFIYIQNPNNEAVTASVTYNTKDGTKPRADLILPPTSQTTLVPADDIGATDFSTVITCLDGKPIAVDREMIWLGSAAQSTEGHSSVGVNSPATTWYLPEGSCSWGFECWLLIQNPNSQVATCQITYMVENVGPRTVTKTVPIGSRQTFNMADDLQDVAIKDASIKVTSDVPVIPERAMYRNNRREGHDSIGTTSPATDYFLAEGATGWSSGFITYVLIQNPHDTATDVSLTYMTQAGSKAGPSFQMPANSRKTVRVNDQLPANTDVSTKVHGSQSIIAERAMYWGGTSSLGEACHDSIGMSAPHTCFYLPDGGTQNGQETWTLVQNPNSSDVVVEITYMSPSGTGNTVFTDTVPALSRKTYNMADKIKSAGAAVMVRSTDASKKIMVERAIYWSNRGAGTETIGGYSD